MKTPAALFLLILVCSATGSAQKVNLNLDSVGAKAARKAEIALDGATLAFLKGVINQKADPKIREIFDKVDSVSILSYEFDKKGNYSDADLAPIRSQLTGAKGWSRVVRSKESEEETEIYILNQGGAPTGLLVISAQPKELSVVQITGVIQLAQMQELIKSTIQYAKLAQ